MFLERNSQVLPVFSTVVGRHFDLQRASRLDLAFQTPNLALGSASRIGPKKNLTEVRGQTSARAVGEVTERRSTMNLI